MNIRGSVGRRRAGNVILAGAFFLAVIMGWGVVCAGERYGMPSEEQARRHAYTGAGQSVEQVVTVESLRKQEDRLFVNGEPFILKRQAQVEDERGRRIGLEDIPLGAQIEVQYHTGANLEESGYGPEARILTRIRLLQAPPGNKPAP